MGKSHKVGIVGATGAVGRELILLLEQRAYPVHAMRFFASRRSAGKTLTFAGAEIEVEDVEKADFADLDVVFFSAGGDLSRRLVPVASAAGALVIDNSSAFRMDPGVPLVVPEVNPRAFLEHRGIVANPNCSTAVALMALAPLHRVFGLRRFFASTYQAVSGAGASGQAELEDQLRSWASGAPLVSRVFPRQVAFNVLPQVDAFLDDGYTKEEMKMENESRKILGLPELRVSCTCVRVPVLRAHSIALSAEFDRPVDLEIAREAIRAFPGAELEDEPTQGRYPVPLDYSGKENCGVGRLRIDHAFDNGLSLWVTGDQLWKGAALNAIQIAELSLD